MQKKVIFGLVFIVRYERVEKNEIYVKIKFQLLEFVLICII